jgi:hypothetical protein
LPERPALREGGPRLALAGGVAAPGRTGRRVAGFPVGGRLTIAHVGAPVRDAAVGRKVVVEVGATARRGRQREEETARDDDQHPDDEGPTRHDDLTPARRRADRRGYRDSAPAGTH